MMAHIVVETASLADALNHAIKVAPEKGDGFEKFQGVLIEQLDDEYLRVSALDSDNTWQRRVAFESCDGHIAWRISSLVAKFIVALPMSGGELLTIEEGAHGRLAVTSGVTRGEFATLDALSFPRFSIEPNLDAMATVNDLVAKIKQISFAVSDTKGSPLTGIHINGTQLIACDQHVAARVPCEIPVSKAVTAALASLSGALRRADEVQMGAIGNRLVMMTDEDTVVSSIIIEGAYPDTTKLWKMTEPCNQQVEFDAAEALSVLARILVLCRADQYPTCSVTFSEGAMIFDMEIPDLGRVTDEAPCKSIIDESFTIKFSPRELRDAFTAAAGTVQMYYQRDAMKAVRIDAGEFSTVMMPKYR